MRLRGEQIREPRRQLISVQSPTTLVVRFQSQGVSRKTVGSGSSLKTPHCVSAIRWERTCSHFEAGSIFFILTRTRVSIACPWRCPSPLMAWTSLVARSRSTSARPPSPTAATVGAHARTCPKRGGPLHGNCSTGHCGPVELCRLRLRAGAVMKMVRHGGLSLSPCVSIQICEANVQE